MTTASAETNVSDYDPFTAEVIRDVHRFDGELREQTAVAYLERYEIWAITRYAEVQAAAKDHETFSSTSRPFDDPSAHAFKPNIPLGLDPPEHTRVRNVIHRAVSPAALRKMREVFEREAVELVDRLLADGPVELDAHTDVAVAYALRAFPDVLGLPDEGRENLLRLGDAVFNVTGPRNEIWHERIANATTALEWVDRNTKRAAQREDGVCQVIFAAADAGEISEEEAEQLVKALFAAGFDTTIASIGSALAAFAANPEQWQLLRADHSLARNAFEEALRLHSPSRYGGRVTTRAVEVAGVTIPAGAPLLLMWLSANRDPRRWDLPDRFDISRSAVGHVALGFGVHTCVGQALARLEGQAMLRALVERVEAIEATAPAITAINMQAHGHSSVPVRLTPTSR